MSIIAVQYVGWILPQVRNAAKILTMTILNRSLFSAVKIIIMARSMNLFDPVRVD
jgi:hypothetical protein